MRKGLLYIVWALLYGALISCEQEKTQNRTALAELAGSLDGYFSDKGAWFCLSQPENGRSIIGAPIILSDSNGYRFREELLTLSAVTVNNYEI